MSEIPSLSLSLKILIFPGLDSTIKTSPFPATFIFLGCCKFFAKIFTLNPSLTFNLHNSESSFL